MLIVLTVRDLADVQDQSAIGEETWVKATSALEVKLCVVKHAQAGMPIAYWRINHSTSLSHCCLLC